MNEAASVSGLLLSIAMAGPATAREQVVVGQTFLPPGIETKWARLL